MMKIRQFFTGLIFATLVCNVAYCMAASAYELGQASLDLPEKYTGNSVAENVTNMDTDHNGFADVDEVRAYLALKHGKNYQKEILDRWEISAKGKSCGTSLLDELSNN